MAWDLKVPEVVTKGVMAGVQAEPVQHTGSSAAAPAGVRVAVAAGVGAGVKPLARTARSGRPILALDGCPLHCVRHALARQGVQPTVHVDLSDHGVRKDLHRLPSSAESEAVWTTVVLPALQQTLASAPVDVIPKKETL